MAAAPSGRATPSATSVLEAIRDAIVTGRLAPGERVTEDQLASDLGVSRTPVREALRILQARGYVTTTPYAGSRVREFSHQDIDDSYQARALLEGLATRLAASRITPEEIEQLRESCDRYEALGPTTEANAEAITRENAVFHGIIFGAAESEVIWSSIRTLQELPRPYSVPIAVGHDAATAKRVAEYTHRQLTRALAKADGAWAECLAVAHVLEQRDRFLLAHREAAEAQGADRRTAASLEASPASPA